MPQQLILKSASNSRPSGEWSEDDYDVVADGLVVGRIMKAAAVPVGMSWMWTLGYGYHEESHPHPRLCGLARRRDDGLRQELAAGVKKAPGGPGLSRDYPKGVSCITLFRLSDFIPRRRSRKARGSRKRPDAPLSADAKRTGLCRS
jgi:hypothetical protein